MIEPRFESHVILLLVLFCLDIIISFRSELTVSHGWGYHRV